MKAGAMSNVKNNPLYEQKGEGTNPLNGKADSALKTADDMAGGSQNAATGAEGSKQASDKKNVKAASTSAGNTKDVLEYKDGEDGTTHTGPASHK